jgi:hypothetical protein
MLKNILIKLGILKDPKTKEIISKLIEELNKPEPSTVKAVKKPAKKTAKKAPVKKKAAKKAK